MKAPSIIARVVACMLCVGSPVTRAWAGQSRWPVTAGLLTGTALLDSDDVSFRSYEVYLRQELPWAWDLGGRFMIRSTIDTSAGMLYANRDTAFIASVGPGLILNQPNHSWDLNLGGKVTYLSEDKFPDLDLGGSLQFTSYVGLMWHAFEHLALGYRFEHISNAGLESSNPGLDLVMLDLNYAF